MFELQVAARRIEGFIALMLKAPVSWQCFKVLTVQHRRCFKPSVSSENFLLLVREAADEDLKHPLSFLNLKCPLNVRFRVVILALKRHQLH